MKNIKKKLTGITVAIGTTLSSAVSAFAAGNESILDTAESTIKTYYGKFIGLGMGLAALFAVIAVICMNLPSERTSQQGRQWLVRIFFGVAILCCLGGIFALIMDLTAGSQLDIDTIMK